MPHVTVTGPIEGKSGEEVLKICTELAATLPVRPAPSLEQLSYRASSASRALPHKSFKSTVLVLCSLLCTRVLKQDCQARRRSPMCPGYFLAQLSATRLLWFACAQGRLLAQHAVQGAPGFASLLALSAPARALWTAWARTGRSCLCSVPEGLQPRARQAYKLRFDRVGKAATEFQCVFILVHKDEGVLEAAAAARRLFGQAPSDYMPHLSLLYAKIPDEERTEIAEQLQVRAHILSLRCCTAAVLLLLADSERCGSAAG